LGHKKASPGIRVRWWERSFFGAAIDEYSSNFRIFHMITSAASFYFIGDFFTSGGYIIYPMMDSVNIIILIIMAS